MTYSIIQPPFTLKFEEMPRKELREYNRWFHSIMPERLDILIRAVHQTPGYDQWNADYLPTSLDMLGEWFASQVQTRPRTSDEIQEIQNRNPFPIEFSNEELTNRTFSLAIDVGMYVSQVFLKGHPTLPWGQPLGSKRFVDYGQPVLMGFGGDEFNPVEMMVVLAYGVMHKTKGGSGLRKVYDIWERLIEK